VRQHLVLVFEFDFEHGIGQRLKNRCHHLNRVFFAHALLGSFQLSAVSYQFSNQKLTAES
jgi:hypothetical protein